MKKKSVCNCQWCKSGRRYRAIIKKLDKADRVFMMAVYISYSDAIEELSMMRAHYESDVAMIPLLAEARNKGLSGQGCGV